MGCGCRRNNQFAPRAKSGPYQTSALAPRSVTNKNIITPQTKQNIAQTSSQTPSAPRSESAINSEKRRIQQVRRDAIKRAFGK